ncbi:MAG: NTP transferase domain-containing protein [Moorea sp. SIO1F2]|uniref:sugar phosphate nucleotidyltransferase n=1 Tax=unclassified Moorena TaxID=2683338 RepID=UPI0013B7851A|nr:MULTISPECIES: sugar phosphate nucleotidyltransferase [unclassified Moorena]NEN94798.1 NTP transferase domain-containing protein [Moorena sp. SIO3I7]NEO44063.1 NTP transferase domain-containing protein [Moorena sp. SIO4A3]NEO64697.1 NTP transferase domain-containing protein [Moorena sp. SIO4G2]NEO05749.1 NTP transferase domain-containing protein [Moorena sp. SIO3I8]NEO22859.1 NTP transferase domain-containing protein [Moorena sp. SIO4A5]
MKAVILAGGKGTRLKPFTVNFPKPLVPLGDVPIIEILIRRLLRYGITNITLTLGHLAELVKAYFDHRHSLVEKINLDFVEEEEPTGTAGSLSFIPNLDQTFLVMNGDLLTDLNFNHLIQFHRDKNAALTIACYTRNVKIDLGVLKLNDHHQVIDYIEKPETSYPVSMGIYAYEPRVLKYIEYGKYLDLPDLVLRLIEEGEQVCAYPANCLWLDIGRPDDYAKAQDLFAEKREEFDLV